MALVTYTIGIDGAGKPTISPDVDVVEFRPGDYVVFNGTDDKVVVQVQMPLKTHFVGCVTAAPCKIRQPQLDSDGNVVLAFEQLGGDGSGTGGFPNGTGGTGGSN